MGRITRFSQIPEYLNYPPNIKGRLSIIHSNIITFVIAQGQGTSKYLRDIICFMNTASYKLMNDEDFDYPAGTLPDFNLLLDDMDIRPYLLDKNMYIDSSAINWSLDNVEKQIAGSEIITPVITQTPLVTPVVAAVPAPNLNTDTPKEDLYLQPPVVPRFNVTAQFAGNMIGDTYYVVYESSPVIPTKQNEISATTDINKMTNSDLMKLFPNRTIHTRGDSMYQDCPGLENHPILGLIIPIKGFTRKQVIDNIVKYPHIYKLTRLVDNELISFYTSIEIKGELHKISQYWNNLPESKTLPYTRDFVKEYVVRRYLLERDLQGVEHQYPLFGELHPFLTLFTTPEIYAELGYKDPLKLATGCVNSRVAFKRSRNPVLRRLDNV